MSTISSQRQERKGKILSVFNDGVSGHWRGLILFDNFQMPSYVVSEIPLSNNINDIVSINGRIEQGFNTKIQDSFIVSSDEETILDSFKNQENLHISSYGPQSFRLDVAQVITETFPKANKVEWNITLNEKDRLFINSIRKEIDPDLKIIITDKKIDSPMDGPLEVVFNSNKGPLETWNEWSSNSSFIPRSIAPISSIRRFNLLHGLLESYSKKFLDDQSSLPAMSAMLFVLRGGDRSAVEFKISAKSISMKYKDNIEALILYKVLSVANKIIENGEDISLSNIQKHVTTITEQYTKRNREKEYKNQLNTFFSSRKKWKLMEASSLSTEMFNFVKKNKSPVSVNLRFIAFCLPGSIYTEGDMKKEINHIQLKNTWEEFTEDLIDDFSKSNMKAQIVPFIKRSQGFINYKINQVSRDSSSNPILDLISRLDVIKKKNQINGFGRLDSSIFLGPLRRIVLPISNLFYNSDNETKDTWTLIQKSFRENLNNNKALIKKVFNSQSDDIKLSPVIDGNENPMLRLKKWGRKAEEFTILHHKTISLNRDLSDSEIRQYNDLGRIVQKMSSDIYMDKVYFDFIEKMDSPYRDLEHSISELLDFKPIVDRVPSKIHRFTDLKTGVDYINNPDVIKNYKHILYLSKSSDQNAECLDVNGMEENIDWDKISTLEMASVQNVRFTTDDLAYKNLNGATFEKCNFELVDGTQINFTNCELTSCSGINPSLDLSKAIVNVSPNTTSSGRHLNI